MAMCVEMDEAHGLDYSKVNKSKTLDSRFERSRILDKPSAVVFSNIELLKKNLYPVRYTRSV